MNRTSCSCSEERMAARSPGCWTAGPEVSRRAPSSSAAMIIASVVLPSPGGPESRTWSGAEPRARAASRTRASWSRTTACPTKSASRRGRSAASAARSSSSASASRYRSSGTGAASQVLQGGTEHGGDVAVGLGGGEHRGHGVLGGPGGPAELDEGLDDLRGGVQGGRRGGGQVTAHRAELVPDLEQDALGALAPDARHLGEGGDVLGGDGGAQLVRTVDGEHGQRQPGPHPGDRLEGLEDVAFVVLGEAVERQRVLAHDEGGGQVRLAAGPQRGERRGGGLDEQTHPAHRDDGGVEPYGLDGPPDAGDHFGSLSPPRAGRTCVRTVRLAGAQRRPGPTRRELGPRPGLLGGGGLPAAQSRTGGAGPPQV